MVCSVGCCQVGDRTARFACPAIARSAARLSVLLFNHVRRPRSRMLVIVARSALGSSAPSWIDLPSSASVSTTDHPRCRWCAQYAMPIRQLGESAAWHRRSRFIGYSQAGSWPAQSLAGSIDLCRAEQRWCAAAAVPLLGPVIGSTAISPTTLPNTLRSVNRHADPELQSGAGSCAEIAGLAMCRRCFASAAWRA